MLVAHEIAPRAGNPPHPVLVLLHGFGADEQDLVPVAESLDDRFLAVLFRAPQPLADWPGFQWYSFAQRGQPEPRSYEASLGALVESLEELCRRREVDANRLVLGGFSQGAVMTATVAARAPSIRPKALLLLSGYLPAGLTFPDLTGLDVFIGHGTEDPLIPVQAAQDAAQRLAAAGARVTLRTYPMPHAVLPSELRDIASFLEPLL
jgi:phospholipase/carboxylesterase